jgi:hypothetical protein
VKNLCGQPSGEFQYENRLFRLNREFHFPHPVDGNRFKAMLEGCSPRVSVCTTWGEPSIRAMPRDDAGDTPGIGIPAWTDPST